MRAVPIPRAILLPCEGKSRSLADGGGGSGGGGSGRCGGGAGDQPSWMLTVGPESMVPMLPPNQPEPIVAGEVLLIVVSAASAAVWFLKRMCTSAAVEAGRRVTCMDTAAGKTAASPVRNARRSKAETSMELTTVKTSVALESARGGGGGGGPLRPTAVGNLGSGG